jgi:hypothetical protein
MELLPSPSPKQLAQEIREAFKQVPRPSPRDLFIEMVREGRINARGELTKLFGGSAEPEPNRETWLPPDQSANGKPKK